MHNSSRAETSSGRAESEAGRLRSVRPWQVVLVLLVILAVVATGWIAFAPAGKAAPPDAPRTADEQKEVDDSIVRVTRAADEGVRVDLGGLGVF
jgi:hypothetical protein